MSHLVEVDEIESFRVELAEIGRSIRASFRSHASSFRSSSTVHAGDKNDEQYDLLWAAVERLPTFERITSALFDDNDDASTKGDVNGTRVVNVTKIGAQERRIFMEKLIKRIEDDNLQLLQKIRGRIDKVGVKLPSVEVSYKDLCVEAGCKIVHGKPVPTVWNSVKSLISGIIEMVGSKSRQAKINIIKDVSGIIKPGRMTLLLGPPGCGKTTLLMALSGKLSHSLKVSGEVCYNGHRLEEFVPEKTSAYVSQHDVHIAEITVRETLNFSAGFQGVGSRPDIMKEVSRREKQAGIVPYPDVDAYMKAISVKGLKSTLQTEYILKILGLDLCADTMVGDVIRRGISGGQKKRLTTGEMIVGPAKALFMDEISNGLDTSTTFQIVSCLQHFVHISDATALISLLQPAPETFDLFDDVVLMAEGKIVYHGPRNSILKFFEDCGFKCPERKGVADFLMELVISSKDQAQFWDGSEKPYSFVSVDQFIEKFKDSHIGRQLDEELSVPFDKSLSHKDALSHKTYSLPKWELFKACSRREFLLMRRNSFTYVFKSAMLLIIASVTMTVFLRTQMAIDMVHANYYMGALFYSLSILLVDGFPEVSMTVSRIVVFYKQKELCFYPAWAYAIPASILKVPLSLLEAVVWTVLTYYVIGYTPEFGRFFRHFLLLFCLHLTSISMFRFIASIFQTIGASITASVSSILLVTLFGGFIIPITYMPTWLKWGFWICPLTYGEIGLSLNEFQAPRWEKVYANTTLGQQLLESRGLNFEGYFYWISIGALLGFTLLFNIGFTLALTFLKSPGKSLSLISYEKYHQLQGKKDDSSDLNKDRKSIGEPNTSVEPEKGKMVLPFDPLTITFQDVQYYVETPMEMRKSGFEQNRLQLLSDITGAFQPGVLTALMGVSGAGKTTLMDVLCGRKTGGTIEGDIRISGYPKIQDTFARISGYVEQNDIHSPHITVEESVVYSAWLRLPSHIDSKTKAEFVNEVLETIELDGIKDCLVGMAGVSGLSTEQRKRLTLAVELVANPSIMFMDEPTSGLDARSAAIVMRTVKNIVATGRTVVCTIHQPSIDIFEAFDELVLMKVGGRIIYYGQLGRHSRRIIEYFESIPGVPSIKDNYNPATWMLEVTSKYAEGELGIDFAQHYQESTLYKRNKELVKKLSSPSSGSKDLKFPTRYPQNGWGQFKVCYWKQNLSYWRNPSHNLTRIAFMFIFSVLLGILFWNQGEEINNQQELFNVFGAMYAAILFLCIYNSTTVLPIVATERAVLNRERYAGMFSSWASSLAQVLVEVPYSFTQAVVYVAITYPLIGYHLSTYKIFWSFYVMFCTLLSFNYLGMLLVSLSPTIQVASILASSTYTMLNLFSGFVIPGPQIPKWWVWAYYLSPTSWALKGMFTSQYGDLQKEIVAFGERKTIAAFVEDYFGYHHSLLGLVAVVLLLIPIVHASLFAFFIGKLNFQRR